LSIGNGDFKQFLKVIVSLIPPLRDKFSVEDKNVGKGVEEKDNVVFDGYTVEKYGHRGNIESVRHRVGRNSYPGCLLSSRIACLSCGLYVAIH
jgi:hypothetical protein